MRKPSFMSQGAVAEEGTFPLSEGGGYSETGGVKTGKCLLIASSPRFPWSMPTMPVPRKETLAVQTEAGNWDLRQNGSQN